MQLRRRQIKMQFLDLHFKHPHILHTSDELSRSNFFLQSPEKNLRAKVGVSEMQIRELHFYLPTPYRQNEMHYKIHLSTLIPKRNATFQGAFLLRLSAVHEY